MREAFARAEVIRAASTSTHVKPTASIAGAREIAFFPPGHGRVDDREIRWSWRPGSERISRSESRTTKLRIPVAPIIPKFARDADAEVWRTSEWGH